MLQEERRKNYSKPEDQKQDVPWKGFISIGLFNAAKAHVKKNFDNNMSAYTRKLLMTDLNVDENGNSRK